MDGKTLSGIHIASSIAAANCIRQAYSSPTSEVISFVEDRDEYPPIDKPNSLIKTLLASDLFSSGEPIYVWASWTVQDLLFLGHVLTLLTVHIPTERIFWVYSNDHDNKPTWLTASEVDPTEINYLFSAYTLDESNAFRAVALYTWWMKVTSKLLENSLAITEDEIPYYKECQRWLLDLVPSNEDSLCGFDKFILEQFEILSEESPDRNITASVLLDAIALFLSETCFRPSELFIWQRIIHLKKYIQMISISPREVNHSTGSYRDYLLHPVL